MSQNPMGLHGLLQGQSFTFYHIMAYSYSRKINCRLSASVPAGSTAAVRITKNNYECVSKQYYFWILTQFPEAVYK
jgi:hypothetical protein